jgi:hypothetical protein
MVRLEESILAACNWSHMPCEVTLITPEGDNYSIGRGNEAERVVVAQILYLGNIGHSNVDDQQWNGSENAANGQGDKESAGHFSSSGPFHFTIAGLLPSVVKAITMTSSSPFLSAPLTSKQDSKTTIQESSDPVMTVLMVDRLGVCGNGICEVGEQMWKDSSAMTAAGSSIIQVWW